MILPWFFVARHFVYFENQYTDLARAIIFYIAEPLLITVKFLAVCFLIWLALFLVFKVIRKMNIKRIGIFVGFLAMPILFSGCLAGINKWACSFFDDPDHCMQNMAIQSANPDDCAHIKGEDFASSGSNPPRDKCYKTIAENTGDASICDEIEGGMYSYTKEECIASTAVKNDDPGACMGLSGESKRNCLSQLSSKIYPGSVMEIDDQIDLLEKELAENPDENLAEQLAGLKQRRDDYLDVMSDDNKSEYEALTDPMNKKAALDFYSGEIDEKTKDTLVALNNSLREKGEQLSDKEYKALSDMLAYKNDPKNDIENMDDEEILKLRWNEKLSKAGDALKFWKSNRTEKEKKYDEQLLFYKRMLERQKAIDNGLSQQQQDMEREMKNLGKNLKDKVGNAALEVGKEMAFGELLDLVDSPASTPVNMVLDEALKTVQEEAANAEFRGLTRAYNQGMEEELAKAGGDIEKAHKAVTENLQQNPYMYEEKHRFAKYGNLIENNDCDGKNPHCIDKEVFWKAMKKSYKYQNK